MKALLVDPSSSMICMLSALFANYGFAFRVAVDGQSALEVLEREPVDLICFTYELGDMDGVEFLTAAKSQKLVHNQPCLMFSSSSDKEVITRALTSGVTECFSKRELHLLEHFVERFAENNRRRISGCVLLVEDSATSALFCKQILERIGLHVDLCRTAEEAIVQFAAQEYDLVLVDYVLDGVQSGLSVIRAVRESEGKKEQTPILAISAFGDTARKVEILRSGANDFVSKPMVAEELEVRIQNLLKTQKLIRQLESQHEAIQHAMDEIKTLKGIVPICSYCKKIRDDSGYWNQLETYIRDHSGADFSHGICPDCLKERLTELEQGRSEESKP